MVLENIT